MDQSAGFRTRSPHRGLQVCPPPMREGLLTDGEAVLILVQRVQGSLLTHSQLDITELSAL